MTSPLTWPMSAPLARSITAPLGTLMGAARGGGGIVFSDAFIASGANTLWYTTTTPAAEYYAGTNKAVFSWESNDARGRRQILVKEYDFATDEWSGDYFVTNDTLTDDSHGVTAICRDNDGYYYLFGGAHVSTMKWWRSANTNDITGTWIAMPSLASYGAYAYPHPVIIGTKLYLFMRGNASSPWFAGYLTLLIGDISAGAVTWGSPKNLVSYYDGVDSNRFYFGALELSEDESTIYIVSAWSNNADTRRRDVYEYAYKISDGSLSNIQGTRTDASGAQPVSLANAKTYYRLVDHETGGLEGGTPNQCRDVNGNLHIFYTEGVADSGDYDVKHIYWNGSALSTPEVVTSLPAGAAQNYSGIASVPNADGTVTIQFTSDGGKPFDRGGDQSRMTWSPGDTWSSATLVKASGDTYPLDQPIRVSGSTMIACCESSTGDIAIEIGLLKGYVSDIGAPFIKTRWGPDVNSIIRRMPTEPSVPVCRAMKRAVDGFHDDALWTMMFELWVPFSHSAGAALIPWRTSRLPLVVTGSPTFSAYGGYTAVSGGYWDTGVAANSISDSGFSIGCAIKPNAAGSALAGTIATANNLNFAYNLTTPIAAFGKATSNIATYGSPAKTSLCLIGDETNLAQTLFENGSQIASATAVRVASNTETILFGRRLTVSSTATFYAMFIGVNGWDATKAGLFYAHMKAFLNSITPGTMA